LRIKGYTRWLSGAYEIPARTFTPLALEPITLPSVFPGQRIQSSCRFFFCTGKVDAFILVLVLSTNPLQGICSTVGELKMVMDPGTQSTSSHTYGGRSQGCLGTGCGELGVGARTQSLELLTNGPLATSFRAGGGVPYVASLASCSGGGPIR